MRFLLFIVFVMLSITCFSQTEKYSRAQIDLSETGKDIRALQALGIAVDHGEYKKGVSFTSDFSATELALIQQSGFKVTVLIDDVQKFYSEQNKPSTSQSKKKSASACSPVAVNTPLKPQHFHLGSYAGYYTYQELLDELDSMRAAFPNLISVKQAIDTFHTIEGRPIYWLRVSNHPDSNQTKPQLIYTALHHAREPASISQQIYCLWYLLENYSSNAQVQSIVDNCEMYFVPCLNPDGYLYNQINFPSGGGMWRKNRRDNLDGTYGVDLNRNYGYFWGYDNIGSSNNTSSDTYRGTSGFSEPETQAIKWFIEQHQFAINLNYHTYSNDLIYPWGYIASFKTPDSLLFDAYGSFLTKYNNYKYGTGDQTVGYVTNGDSDDWGYGEQTSKNKVFSFTPEVGPGSTGFYPPATDIEGLCADNLFANLNAAKLILQYARVSSASSPICTQLTNEFAFQLQRLGLANGGTFTVSIQALDNWVLTTGSSKTYSNMVLLQQVTDSISFSLNPAITNGQPFRMLLTVNNGMYDESDTITLFYRTATSITSTQANAWNWASGTWSATTSDFYSAPTSITDSPNGNYIDNSFNVLNFSNELDLTNATAPALSYYCKWQLEAAYDYVALEVSTDHGSTWTPACGLYTHDGSANQLQNQPIYDGDHLMNWVKELIDLQSYANQKIKLRFVLAADNAVNGDGFYFDDFTIIGIDTSLHSNGFTEANVNDAIQLIPNPATRSIRLTSIDNELVQIRIMNALGMEIPLTSTTLNTVKSTKTIAIDDLTPGYYTIQLINKDGHFIQKHFIKISD